MKEFVKVDHYPKEFWPNDSQPLWFWLHVGLPGPQPDELEYSNLEAASAAAADYALAHDLPLVIEDHETWVEWAMEQATRRVKESLLGPSNV